MTPLPLALVAVVLLGAALVWALVADSRRQLRHQRLKSITATTRDEAEPPPVPTLRRRMARARPGLQRLPTALWAQLISELAAAGNRIGTVHLAAAACVTGLATFAFLAFSTLVGPVPALIAGLIAAPVGAAALLALMQRRYRARFLEVFPDALDLVCRAVKAGLPVTEAMAVAGREIADPVGSELRHALSEMQIGAEPQDALERMADRIRIPDFRFYVVALALQRRTGGGLAETLSNLSSVIRARKALRLKARALAAETKMSATVLALLPFLVVGVLYLINPSLMSVLFTDHRGRIMIAVALIDLLMGIGVMAWIIRRALR